MMIILMKHNEPVTDYEKTKKNMKNLDQFRID